MLTPQEITFAVGLLPQGLVYSTCGCKSPAFACGFLRIASCLPPFSFSLPENGSRPNWSQNSCYFQGTATQLNCCTTLTVSAAFFSRRSSRKRAFSSSRCFLFSCASFTAFSARRWISSSRRMRFSSHFRISSRRKKYGEERRREGGLLSHQKELRIWAGSFQRFSGACHFGPRVGRPFLAA